MRPVTIVLLGGLRALARRPGPGPLHVPVSHPRSLKDAVESLGIPHTEIASVEVDATARGLDHRLRGGETVRVHDVLAPPSSTPGVAPGPPRPVRVVADVHLGTLARRLRVLGVDTWWRNDADDAELATLAADEGRVLLSRDRGLLMRRRVRHGALVRTQDPDEQLAEVVARLGLGDQLAPGTRCPRCNGPVRTVAATEVAGRLEPGTRAAGHTHVGECVDCGQLYWPGAHAAAIAAIAAAARQAERDDAAGSDSAPSAP